MAKGSQFWGSGSGKLGEQVLYRAGGEQRARAYVKKIKNPKTLAQMKNRISMKNLNAVFNLLKPILKDSFTTRKANQSGFNAFIQANKKVNSPVIDPTFIQYRMCVPYGMTLSKGSIVLPDLEAGDNDKFTYSLSNVTVDMASWTQQQLVEYWLQSLGVPTDAKITIVAATFQDEGWVLNTATAQSTNIEKLKALPDVVFSVEVSNDGEDNMSGWVEVALRNNESMYAVIISYTDSSGKLQITTSRMQSADLVPNVISTFLPGGEVYEGVLNGYGYTENSVLSTD